MTRTETRTMQSMQPIRSIQWTVWATVAAALLLSLRAPAAAVDRGPYTMEILIDGRPLAEYEARGRTYVEALAGREYSVRLTNHTGQRVAIALSVDGLNSIDAQTSSARDAAKWILGPYETITLDGWQTSSAAARRFYFTTEPDSYGAWLRETDNLGTIAAAVFRERVPKVAPIQRQSGAAKPRSEAEMRSGAPAPSAPPAAGRDAAGQAGAAAEASPVLSDELAATGIGREIDHRVERVRFDAEPAPAALLEVRYEYRDALVRLGVLPARCGVGMDALARRERARGFEPGFAPDPYRRGDCR
jgi:hypothetical protein